MNKIYPAYKEADVVVMAVGDFRGSITTLIQALNVLCSAFNLASSDFHAFTGRKVCPLIYKSPIPHLQKFLLELGREYEALEFDKEKED